MSYDVKIFDLTVAREDERVDFGGLQVLTVARMDSQARPTIKMGSRNVSAIPIVPGLKIVQQDGLGVGYLSNSASAIAGDSLSLLAFTADPCIETPGIEEVVATPANYTLIASGGGLAIDVDQAIDLGADRDIEAVRLMYFPTSSAGQFFMSVYGTVDGNAQGALNRLVPVWSYRGTTHGPIDSLDIPTLGLRYLWLEIGQGTGNVDGEYRLYSKSLSTPLTLPRMTAIRPGIAGDLDDEFTLGQLLNDSLSIILPMPVNARRDRGFVYVRGHGATPWDDVTIDVYGMQGDVAPAAGEGVHLIATSGPLVTGAAAFQIVDLGAQAMLWDWLEVRLTRDVAGGGANDNYSASGVVSYA